jgi:hypothetical protein
MGSTLLSYDVLDLSKIVRLVRQEEHSMLDIKNTSTSLEITTAIPDVQIIY